MAEESAGAGRPYFTPLLELVDRRLRPLEEPPSLSPAERESARRLELRRGQRLWERRSVQGREGEILPLEYLFSVFGLNEFERHCVCLALAPELDSAYEARYAALQPDGSRLPTLELCLQAFPSDGGREELLARWMGREELLSLFFRSGHRGQEGRGGLTAGLKLDRRVVGFLFDVMSPDPAIEWASTLYWPGEDLPAPVLREEELDRMTAFLEAVPPRTPVLFHLRGAAGSGRLTLARRLCGRENRPLLSADLAQLAAGAETMERALIPLLRETAIRGAALALAGLEKLLPDEEPPPGEDTPASPQPQQDWMPNLRMTLTRAAQVTDRLFLFSEIPWPPGLSPKPWRKIELVLDTPDTAGRLRLWRRCLEGAALDAATDLEPLAVKFALEPGQIAAAAREAAQLALWEKAPAITEDILHRACRAQLSHRLGRMASRVNAAYTWEDLILPPEQKERLKNACAQVEYRHRVYDQWGFGKKVAYGRGLSMLFTGPPGTGKTMAAQVIANRLGLELYRVDLSGVLSKYIGETEKQLGAVFDEVKKSQSILFFDEADALFGKRSETRDAHDRYANIQTSYLLQKMEEYEGVVILASNFQQNFDEAFKRRLKFIIEFTLPDRDRRERIWRSVLPPELPLGEDIDFDFLARSLELSGSGIKNIAVAGAFLAAAEDAPLGMVHLLLAAQAEQNKTGKNMGREDFGEYYLQVRAHRANRHGQE